MYGRVRSVSRAMVLAIVESGYEIAASEYDVTAHSTSAGVFVCDGSMCDDVTIGTIGDVTMATVDDATIGGATRGTAIFETMGATIAATGYVRTTGAKLDDDDFELLAALAMEATGAVR